MMQRKIKLSVDEVENFVKAACNCAFDIDISYNRYVVDAKSIMGIFSLDLSKPIDLNIHTEEGADEVLEFLKPYIVQ